MSPENRLTVGEEVPKHERVVVNHRCYRCTCSCGKVFIASGTYLRRGFVRSCGCLQRDTASKTLSNTLTTHGLSRNPLYRVWVHMIDRCFNPNYIQWEDYGGRGITVCLEWKGSPVEFVEWAKKNGWEKGLELNRKDNNGSYHPDNCNFVTHSENQLNKRKKVKVAAYVP